MSARPRLRVREYGAAAAPTLVLVHGGPGAPGSLGPLARSLAREFHVLEPWQRPSGGSPLTVDLHVADLHLLIRRRCPQPPPVLIGHSWGAMLTLACAAAHPESVAAIVLIGCGTFDRCAREKMHQILQERPSPELRRQLEELEREVRDPDERMRRRGDLLERLYNFDPVEVVDDGAGGPVSGSVSGSESGPESAETEFDGRSNRESWADMLRLQEAGVYPAAFSAIDAPVLMLHGAYDPHPGVMIRDSLAPHLRRLEYREWEECGHSPWRERRVAEEFRTVLSAWVRRVSAG